MKILKPALLPLLLLLSTFASAQFKLPIPEAIQQKFTEIEQMQYRIRTGVRQSGTQLKTGGGLIGGGLALNIIGTILIAASPPRIRTENGVTRATISGGQVAGIGLNACGLGLDVAGVFYLFKSGNTMRKTFAAENFTTF